MLRRVQFVIIGATLIVVAFSTGADFLFFLVYLGVLVVGGSYVLTRYGLSDLEAGYTLDRLQGQVGETLRATYTLRNTSRLPKLWLEAYNPSTLPVPLPGRALALGPTAERTWTARVPLVRRGHYRIDPLVIRTGDPFGLFEASATVGGGSGIVVYPRVESLPRWRLPAAQIEGSHTSPERTIQSTPLVTSIRAYLPGDAFNRIHWKQSARHQDLQVKEFDLEQTADVWVFLDLQRDVQVGAGDESTLEASVRVAAAVLGRALNENRAVGLTATAHRTTVVPGDRGARQYQKVMQLLAAVTADGTQPLVEGILRDLPRLRRGMTAVVITPSLERSWIRPLATLRSRGVRVSVCLLDQLAYAEYGHGPRGDRDAEHLATDPIRPPTGDAHEVQVRAARNVRHALAEYDLPVHVILPGRALGELLVSRGPAPRPARV